MARKSLNQKGFGLVELLVVVAMMGIVSMAFLSQYQTTQRTATTHDALAVAQQNLRIAMDKIGYDLRMAGFLVVGNAVQVAGSDTITINNAAEPLRMIRIAKTPITPSDPAPYDNTELRDYAVPGDLETGNPTRVEFAVDLPESVYDFESPNKVRLYSSAARTPIAGGRIFEVVGRNAVGTDYHGNDPVSLTLDGFVSTDTFSIPAGSLITRVNGSCYPTLGEPNQIAFSLVHVDDNGDGAEQVSEWKLWRAVNGSTNANCAGAIADSITAMKFTYILNSSSGVTDEEWDPADDGALPADEVENIKAVRVTLSAQVTSQEGDKTKTLSSLFQLRNKR
ncbi:MAG: hypothetical protein C0621_11200 [Desulfuromonas sp.]|nr:MAG: hypothetical protein C0621_11200 [Desulfuromonas sp.]